jgi:hypothetical protein
MSQINPKKAENRPSENLSEDDKREVSDRGAGSAKVVHEVVRLQGDEDTSDHGGGANDCDDDLN